MKYQIEDVNKYNHKYIKHLVRTVRDDNEELELVIENRDIIDLHAIKYQIRFRVAKNKKKITETYLNSLIEKEHDRCLKKISNAISNQKMSSILKLIIQDV